MNTRSIPTIDIDRGKREISANAGPVAPQPVGKQLEAVGVSARRLGEADAPITGGNDPKRVRFDVVVPQRQDVLAALGFS